MELRFTAEGIEMERELGSVDRFALDFVGILERLGIRYVIISGYIAILFGRSRGTEDVDMFIERLGEERFGALWSELGAAGFECINAPDAHSALHEYLEKGTALRFARPGEFDPNVELKFPRAAYNKYSLEHRLAVRVNGQLLWTSELELQVAFKLSLGSEKDLEDARHLYGLLKARLDRTLLEQHIRALGVERLAEEVLLAPAP